MAGNNKRTFKRFIKWFFSIIFILLLLYAAWIYYLYVNIPLEARVLLKMSAENRAIADLMNNPEKYANLPCTVVSLHDGKDKFCFDRSRAIYNGKWQAVDGTEGLELLFVSSIMPKSENNKHVIDVSFTDPDYYQLSQKKTVGEYHLYNLVSARSAKNSNGMKYKNKLRDLINNEEANDSFADITDLLEYSYGEEFSAYINNKRIEAYVKYSSNEHHTFYGDIHYQTPEMPMSLKIHFRISENISKKDFLRLQLNVAKEVNQFFEESRIKGD